MSVVHSFPHTGHLPTVPDCFSGMQRLDTPAFSFIASSHSRLPHYLVRAKPPLPCAISLTSSQEVKSKVVSSRFFSAMAYRLS